MRNCAALLLAHTARWHYERLAERAAWWVARHALPRRVRLCVIADATARASRAHPTRPALALNYAEIAGAACLVLALAACTDAPTGLTPTASLAVAGASGAPACSTYPHSAATVTVSSNSQLTSAMNGAVPGRLIVVNAGVYTVQAATKVDGGTGSNRIILCGSGGPRIRTGYGLTGIAVNHDNWTIVGLTTDSTNMGLEAKGADNLVVEYSTFRNAHNHALGLRLSTKRALVRYTYCENTGAGGQPQYGECFYIGTTASQSTTDHSDSATIYGNTCGPKVPAQCIDVKDGSGWTKADSNTADGSALNTSLSGNTGVMNFYGHDATVTRNVLTGVKVHGSKVEQIVTGQGVRNVFRLNKTTMASGATGYAHYVGGPTSNGNKVYCDNTVTNGRLSNVACTP